MCSPRWALCMLFAAQRGGEQPVPTYAKDQSFGAHPLDVHSARPVAKWLGCLANTVIIYDLKGD